MKHLNQLRSAIGELRDLFEDDAVKWTSDDGRFTVSKAAKGWDLKDKGTLISTEKTLLKAKGRASYTAHTDKTKDLPTYKELTTMARKAGLEVSADPQNPIGQTATISGSIGQMGNLGLMRKGLQKAGLKVGDIVSAKGPEGPGSVALFYVVLKAAVPK